MSAERLKRLRARDLAAASLTVLALAMGADEAAAQAQPMPPEHYTLDSRGVDLVTGGFNHSTTDVVIGPAGGGGLVHARQYLEGWRDVEVGGLSMSGTEIVVATGMVSVTFVPDGSGGWTSKYDDGSTFEILPDGTARVTDRDGDVALFEDVYGDWGLTSYAYSSLVTSERSPDGSETTYHWKSACRDGAAPPLCLNDVKQTRLQSITNNRGYQLKFFYASNATNPSADWMRITKVVGLNMAIDYCDPTADACPTFTQNWPSMTYNYVSPLQPINPAPASTTDQSGRTTSYTYSNFRIASVRYPGATHDDIAVTYHASPDLRVSGVTDATGAWTYAYSTSGTTQTTVANGPLGQQTTVIANLTTGRATSVTERTSVSPAVSRTWFYSYDADLRVTRITQPEGNYVAYSYDGRGNLIQTILRPKTNSGLSNVVSSATFPAACINPVICNLPETTTDGRGSVTNYTWNPDHGGPLTITAPAPTTGATRPQTRYTYADFQARYHDSATTFVNGPAITLPVEVSACATGTSCDGAANEVLSTISYPTPSAPNNLLPVSTSRGSGVTPAIATTAMTYTSDGDVATVDGPLPGTADTTTFIHDDARQVIGVIGPDPDAAGPLLNRAQRVTYNSRGQTTLAETGTASGGVWGNFSPLLKSQTTYDPAAWSRPVETRQMSAAGAVSGVQQVSYDAAGRPSCTAVRMNPATFSALPTSACTATTTGVFGPDRIIQMTYDAAGRPISTTAAVGTTEASAQSVTYTPNGRTASLTDGAGNVSIMEYDGLDRIAKLRYPDVNGGGTSTADYEAWTWNASGPITHRNRAGETTTMTWDRLYRLTNVNAPTGTMDVANTYDNLDRMLTTTGNSQTLTTTWDVLSRPLSETGPLGTMAWEYDPASRLTRITWPDAFYVNRDHNLYGEVTAVRENGAASGAGLLASWVYNNLGQPMGVARAGGAGSTTTYGYDAFGRLNSLIQNPSGTTYDLTLGFSYNPAGQIVGREVSNTDYLFTPTTGTTSYEVNGLNQVTKIGAVAVLYDANGETTSVTGNSYGYDAAGRLTSANAGAGAASFTFDPAGRLYQSSVGGVPARFQYSGVQLVGEYDSSGALIRRHVPGLGIDGVVASYVGSGTADRNWPLPDERGSVIALGDSTGVTSQVNLYDEYGIPAPGNVGRFQYTGQAWLVEAGGYYYRARTYLPGLGRFLQTDPIGYSAGANLYAYVRLDPVNLVDPSGLQEIYCSTRTTHSTNAAGESVAIGHRIPCRWGSLEELERWLNYSRDSFTNIVGDISEAACTALRSALGADSYYFNMGVTAAPGWGFSDNLNVTARLDEETEEVVISVGEYVAEYKGFSVSTGVAAGIIWSDAESVGGGAVPEYSDLRKGTFDARPSVGIEASNNHLGVNLSVGFPGAAYYVASEASQGFGNVRFCGR